MQSPGGEDLVQVIAEDLTLAELFIALSRMRNTPIDFQRDRLQQRVTIQSRDGLSIDSLWKTANRLLESHNFACVQPSGEEGLAIVALDQAASIARVEREDLHGVKAGFVKVLVQLRASDVAQLATALREAFEKSVVRIHALPETGHLLLAGLRPSVEDALALIAVLNATPNEVAIEEITLKYADAVTLSALLEQVTQKEKMLEPDIVRGSVVARPDSKSLLVVAPKVQLDYWRERVQLLDVKEARSTRWYVPRRFGLEETAGLLEKVFGVAAGGAREEPRIVTDPLSGSLVVVATENQHLEIEDIFRRLEEEDLPSRRELRSFPVRYRDVEELLELLAALVDAGAALPIPDATAAETEEVSGEVGVQGATGVLQETTRRAIQSDGGAGFSLSADAGSGRILAFGEPQLLREVEDLLKTLDVPRPQVLVEALVVTLSENQVAELGVELRRAGTSEGVLFELASLFGLGSPPTSASGLEAPGGSGGSGVVLDPGTFSAILRALSTQNRGRTVTIPKVLVENHGEATLDSVLHTPYLATNATTTVATTSLGGSEDAGTKISVTPHIGDGDRLRLEYSVSVSSFVGSPADPALPPPRQENKLEASSTLPDGYAVVVGGLEVDSESNTSSSVPFLGKLPVFGWLFRDQTNSSTKSRLFVFLRATVLRSDSLEDLRWATRKPIAEAGLKDGWPRMRPRIMR